MEENMQQVRQRTAVFVFEIYWEVSSTTVENEVLFTNVLKNVYKCLGVGPISYPSLVCPYARVDI